MNSISFSTWSNDLSDPATAPSRCRDTLPTLRSRQCLARVLPLLGPTNAREPDPAAMLYCVARQAMSPRRADDTIHWRRAADWTSTHIDPGPVFETNKPRSLA